MLILFLIVLISLIGIAAAIRDTARDGYRPVPTRADEPEVSRYR